MAIRFTPEYNARIRKIVGNYNRKVTSAKTKGKLNKSDLPEKVKISTLKKSYTKKADLERELRNLELFSRKSARNTVNGAISEYNLNIINANRDAAIKHFEHEVEIVKERAKSNYPHEKERLKVLEYNLALLKKGTKNATESELLGMENYVDKYRKSFERRATGYRGFLSEVDRIMDIVGIDALEKETFFRNFSQLNEQEFYDLYESTDLINEIYELADSPKLRNGELILNNSKGGAKKLIRELLDQQKFLIDKVKSK